MNLFIDTNIYLTFYHYTSDDLEELRKLLVVIKNKEVILLVTDQVIQEFRRNRESKISDALKKLTDQKLPNRFPQICKEYSEYRILCEALNQYGTAQSQILKQLNKDIINKNLGADKIINKLFESACKLKVSSVTIQRAKDRFELGNPPGKNRSYGDAVNWEALLENIKSCEELYFISSDNDYISEIDRSKMCQFLLEEWEEKINSSIHFFQRLSEFFASKFPNIKLASELEKELAINNLVNSGCFTATHNAILNLSKFGDFTDEQIKTILRAAISNSQIYWVGNDNDVRDFMHNLISRKENLLDQDELVSFYHMYGQPFEEINLDDIPF